MRKHNHTDIHAVLAWVNNMHPWINDGLLSLVFS